MNKEELDELLFDAAMYIQHTKDRSISGLQRKFNIGYARAFRIKEQLKTCERLASGECGK